MAMDKEREALVAMVDAAMVEMRNISPPLRRSECERLIKAALTAQQEPVAESHCVWMQDSDGPWNTSCGHVFEFTDGGPHQNNAAWCQYCGGKLLPTYHDGEQESVERNAALLAAAKEPRK